MTPYIQGAGLFDFFSEIIDPQSDQSEFVEVVNKLCLEPSQGMRFSSESCQLYRHWLKRFTKVTSVCWFV